MEEARFPNRKYPRLKYFDYRSENYYFITICTYEKNCIFGKPGMLNSRGKTVENAILQIPHHFSGIRLDKFVVMPNHVHFILEVEKKGSDLFNAVGSFKSSSTRMLHISELDLKVWQRSFYDHVIRNQKSYDKIWNYIDTNPIKWEEDCFYQK